MALGFFDGVHIGHGALLKKTVEVANRISAVSGVLTFDNHPERVILGQIPPLLGTVSDRADLMRSLYGIRDVIIMPFDDNLMHMPWETFISKTVCGELGGVHVVAGHDFHFGFHGEGNPERLSEYCATHNIGCDIMPRVDINGITVSSTYIRRLIGQGDVELAASYLGHNHGISGTVISGQKLGSSIGYPTANILISQGVITPAKGVYVSQAVIGGVLYRGVTNIGVRPTVSSISSITVETTFFDFSGDLYGTTLNIELLSFIRPEQTFDGVEGLREQISKDVVFARQWLRKGT